MKKKMTPTEIYQYKKGLIRELIEIYSHCTGGQVVPQPKEEDIIKEVMSMDDSYIESAAEFNTPKEWANLMTM